ncbi:MAG: hypothetical protein IT561_06290 [Alphaproteobacteria bacterium]|nr:hypothetical protein [Alphaproteobacteria bacterium]
MRIAEGTCLDPRCGRAGLDERAADGGGAAVVQLAVARIGELPVDRAVETHRAAIMRIADAKSLPALARLALAAAPDAAGEGPSRR